MDSSHLKLSTHLILLIGLLTSLLVSCAEQPIQKGRTTLAPPQLAGSLPLTEGKVLVRINVAPDGRTRNVTVAKSSGYKLLDDAAVAAAKEWQLPSGNPRKYLWECRFQLKPEK
jgi:TonB family protein